MRRLRARTTAIFLVALLPVLPTAAGQASRGQLDALLREGQEALSAGDYQAAGQYFERAMAADPRAPEAVCGLGQARMAQRRAMISPLLSTAPRA